MDDALGLDALDEACETLARRLAERMRDTYCPSTMFASTNPAVTGIPHPWRETFPWDQEGAQP